MSEREFLIYVNGTIVANENITNYKSIPLDGFLVLGQEQDEMAGGFKTKEAFLGYIGQFDIWDRTLSSSEVKKLSSCLEFPSGNVFSTDIDEMELFDVISSDVDVSRFCEAEPPNYLIFPTSLNFIGSERFCTTMDAPLYAPKSEKERDTFSEKFTQFKDECDVGIFLGIKKNREGNWIYSDNEKNMTYYNFDPLDAFECVIKLFSHVIWYEYDCTNVLCTSCEFESSLRLFIKGLCFVTEEDSLVYAKGYKNNKPFFHGIYGLFIFFENSQWNLFDVILNMTVAILGNNLINFYPVGRHTWTIVNEYCEFSTGEVRKIGISSCDAGQFMCDNGECIPIENKCDEFFDCFDKSDENDCKLIRFPNGYRSQFFPPSFGQSSVLSIDVKLDVLRIVKVDDINNAFTIEFLVFFSWKDSRLIYLNLGDQEEFNELSKEEHASIWKPKVEFSNINEGQLKKFAHEAYIRKDGPVSPYLHNDIDMGKEYQISYRNLYQFRNFNTMMFLRKN